MFVGTYNDLRFAIFAGQLWSGSLLLAPLGFGCLGPMIYTACMYAYHTIHELHYLAIPRSRGSTGRRLNRPAGFASRLMKVRRANVFVRRMIYVSLALNSCNTHGLRTDIWMGHRNAKYV